MHHFWRRLRFSTPAIRVPPLNDDNDDPQTAKPPPTSSAPITFQQALYTCSPCTLKCFTPLLAVLFQLNTKIDVPPYLPRPWSPSSCIYHLFLTIIILLVDS